MLKIATSNQRLFRLTYSHRWLTRFLTFDLTELNDVTDGTLRNWIVSLVKTEEQHGKFTSRGRFKDLDRIATKYLKGGAENLIHDVAVSSGVTSCEFYDTLSKTADARVFISDKYTNLYYSGDKIIRLFNADKKLLAGYIFSLVADPNLGRRYYVSKLLYYFLNKTVSSESELKEICFFDPQTISYINEGKLKVIDYDVFKTKIINEFTYVRCMNVLNRNSWFSDENISKALTGLTESLKEGGVLQIGRTREDGTNDVSFLVKNKDELQLLENVNSGSEILSLLKFKAI